MELVLRAEQGSGEIRVELEDFQMGPGLAAIRVSVVDEAGREVVPEHAYHFDVREPGTLDLDRYVSEPEELPDLPAFLIVEPFQGIRPRLRGRGAGGA
ncbi:MAG: hypothetical protein AB1609_21725 [Bacillota bacterium]